MLVFFTFARALGIYFHLVREVGGQAQAVEWDPRSLESFREVFGAGQHASAVARARGERNEDDAAVGGGNGGEDRVEVRVHLQQHMRGRREGLRAKKAIAAALTTP